MYLKKKTSQQITKINKYDKSDKRIYILASMKYQQDIVGSLFNFITKVDKMGKEDIQKSSY